MTKINLTLSHQNTASDADVSQISEGIRTANVNISISVKDLTAPDFVKRVKEADKVILHFNPRYAYSGVRLDMVRS